MPLEAYQNLRTLARADLSAPGVTEALREAALRSAALLRQCDREVLVSHVPGKAYFAFSRENWLSRPVNADLYSDDAEECAEVLERVFGEEAPLTAEAITRAFYTLVMSFCCAVDLAKRGDQKTPGTYFEYFVGHALARYLKSNPQREIQVLSLDDPVSLPTDYIFDLGRGSARLHVPVKTSTRERVIQVWAHQRVLDGVYGVDAIRGVLVGLTETRCDRATREVIEICLPTQWQVYQRFIAQMKRVYYLDIPERYRQLAEKRPSVIVKEFGEFFHEADAVIG